jgi:hypothetical protein
MGRMAAEALGSCMNHTSAKLVVRTKVQGALRGYVGGEASPMMMQNEVECLLDLERTKIVCIA